MEWFEEAYLFKTNKHLHNRPGARTSVLEVPVGVEQVHVFTLNKQCDGQAESFSVYKSWSSSCSAFRRRIIIQKQVCFAFLSSDSFLLFGSLSSFTTVDLL